ncbi:cell division protein FtsL [Candidatus Pelagibacter sp.]|nr:cell division protein FtsL [Candidatus Pelagibacter sp.]
MKKLTLISIMLLILITSLVKNSTKEIEDKIFAINESVRSLKAERSDVMLEYNYLSSPEKLIQHQSQYFENDLIKIDIRKIKELVTNGNNLVITDLIINTQDNE